MAKHSITAVFDTRAHAEQAISQLKSSGVSATDITMLPDETADITMDTTKGKGFWGSLEQLFGGTEDHATYAESIRRGGVMVSVRAEDSEIDRIIDILEQHGSVDLDERETTWRSEGWTGSTVATGSPEPTGRSGLGLDSAGMTERSDRSDVLGTAAIGTVAGLGAAAYERRDTTIPATTAESLTSTPAVVTERAVVDRAATTSTTGIAGRIESAGDDVIQVVEERLDVGKRSVNRGKVRVHTRIVSREVSEDIALHRETVTVDRRVVDRPVSVAALDVDPFRERTIELEEYDEEVVVAKSAHVVEEIGIRKDASERVETIHDTLRSTEVDVEDGRRERLVGGSVASFLDEIRDDMEVVGSDGVHVGTVDHLDAGRIKLKKLDPAAEGVHHFLSLDMVKSVAGKVVLAATAAEAKTRWTA